MSPLAPVRPARVATVARFVALATAALVMIVLVAAAPARAQSPIDSPVLPEPTAPQLDAPTPGSSTPDPVADDTGFTQLTRMFGASSEASPFVRVMTAPLVALYAVRFARGRRPPIDATDTIDEPDGMWGTQYLAAK